MRTPRPWSWWKRLWPWIWRVWAAPTVRIKTSEEWSEYHPPQPIVVHRDAANDLREDILVAYSVALAALPRLTEDELRAIGMVARSRSLWPGLLAYPPYRTISCVVPGGAPRIEP